MNDKVQIINYQRTNVQRLLDLTEKLFNEQFFIPYLTSQQLIILESLLSIPDMSTKLSIWQELMNGNLKLDVVKVTSSVGHVAIKPSSHDEDDISKSGNGNDVNNINNNSDSSNVNNAEDDDDFSQLDLEDFIQQTSGFEFIGNLSLKIRYVIWQCAIDAMYKDEPDGFDEDEKNVFDYILFEDVANQDISETPLIPAKNDQEDDDYDYDEDDGENEEGGLAKVKVEGNNLQILSNFEVHQSDNDFMVLVLKVSKDIISKLRNNNVEEIMKNCNKIYHNFEHDKETMLKRLRLEKNDELLGVTKKKRSYSDMEADRAEDNIENRDQSENHSGEDSNHADRRHHDTHPNMDHYANNEADNEADHDVDYDAGGTDSAVDGKRPRHDSMNLPVNLGAAHLSLKHLLTSIQENKSKLKISDYELKHLIMDVRKNRSKWASDEKIGQEELYEACEKVVFELRNYTEHSTPFLNKVSKREAPNYHHIIKKSMDLNTVFKKLKTFQYKSKQNFVDDVMLIWKNCLTYNSEPSHFLRGHAIAMQKKSLQLLPLIPDIVIRNRADVEKELEEMDKDKDYDDYEEEEVAGSGRKGLNMGAHKPAKAYGTKSKSKEPDQVHEDSIPENLKDEEKKGKNLEEVSVDLKSPGKSEDLGKEDREINSPTVLTTEDKNEQLPRSSEVGHLEEEDSQKVKENEKNKENEETVQAEKEQTKGQEQEEDGEQEIDQEIDQEIVRKVKQDIKAEEEEEEEHNYDDEDEEEEEEEMAEAHDYFVEKDDDRDDVEISVWKSLTAKVRAEICIKRSQYFQDGKLNNESEAFLKDPQKMKSFEQLFAEYKEQKGLELQRKKLEQESIMKNGFRTAIKHEEGDQTLVNVDHISENTDTFEKESNDIELDNSMFLQEYDTTNSLPTIGYKGVDMKVLDREEDAWVKRMLEEDSVKKSVFLTNNNEGFTPKINKNIELIQQIRHICHKISLIRLLQSPTFAQGSKNASNSNQIISSHRYKFDRISDTLDIDQISQLPTHDYKNNKQLMWKIMHKNVSKISMSSGFETTQPSAINMLTEIAGEYLSNLIQSVKIHHESNSLNHAKPKEVLHVSLLENGINRPDDLYVYVESEFTKKTKKLLDVKSKLEIFLKDLLRPTLQELSERNFDDESQSFLTGDFATELTGEDFFGFKELGLEKEFGVLSSSVPLQLLTFQLQSTDAETKIQVKKIQPEEFHSVVYSKVTKEEISRGSYLGTLLPLLHKSFERSKNYRLRLAKSNATADQSSSETVVDEEPELLLEDDEMILKAKSGSKPRLPPTGKISNSYKKKSLAEAFILPEDEQQIEVRVEEKINPKEHDDIHSQDGFVDSNHVFKTPEKNDAFGMEDLFSQTATPVTNSFDLSLPRVDH